MNGIKVARIHLYDWPRPDFFWRCFPDGIDKYDSVGNVICSVIDSVIREGNKNFPSGHSSWSFAGLEFLSLYLSGKIKAFNGKGHVYLSGKIKAFNGKGHVAKLCLVFLPLLVASLVAISRALSRRLFVIFRFFHPYDSEGDMCYGYREEQNVDVLPQTYAPSNEESLQLRSS